MRTAIYHLLFVSVAVSAITGCVDEAASPAGLQATEQALQNNGVYYLEATGTADNPAVIFYDRNKLAVGDGQTSQDPPQTELQWRGHQWESTGGALRADGGAAAADGADAAERDAALTVFELGLDQAFPSSASGLQGQVHANSCVSVRCSRPSMRCVGGCAGYVCSRTDGGIGTCVVPSGDPSQPRPRPTPNSLPQ